MSEQPACKPIIASTIRKFECDAHDGVHIHQHDEKLLLHFRVPDLDPMYGDKFKLIEITYPEAKCLIKLIHRAVAKLPVHALDIQPETC